ncbi:MAG: apolipoprotein N-acyltransferase [Candidatus Methylacidiphilales bacterium]
MFLAYAPAEQAWLGWVAPVPVAAWFCWVRERRSRAFALGWVWGALFFGLSFFWLTEVTVAGWFAAAVYLGVYPGLWALIWNEVASGEPGSFTSGRNLERAMVGASAWVVGEWLRGWVFSGFPWNDLGVSQAPVAAMIQIADVGGVALVSWLVMFVALILALTLRRLQLEVEAKQRVRTHLDFSIAMFLVGAAFLYGVACLLGAPRSGKELRYLMVQPSIPVSRYAPSEPAVRAIGKLERLTLSALEGLTEDEIPHVVLWPETPITAEFFVDPAFSSGVRRVVEGRPFELVFGSNDMSGERLFNAAMMVRDGEDRVGIYYKNHLVPFGEFVPLTDQFRMLRQFSPLGYNFSAGDLPGIFEIESAGVRAAVLICFEDTVSRVARRSLIFRPEVFFNLTNDGWFGRTAQSRQHLNNARFRTVEFRRPMLRATNNGVTAVISATGVVIDQLGQMKDGSLFEPGTLAGTLIVSPLRPGLFEWIGDWVPWASVGLLVLGLWRWRAPSLARTKVK